MDSHAPRRVVQHGSMVPGVGPANTRVNEILPGLEGQVSIRNSHGHLTFGKTEAKIVTRFMMELEPGEGFLTPLLVTFASLS